MTLSAVIGDARLTLQALCREVSDRTSGAGAVHDHDALGEFSFHAFREQPRDVGALADLRRGGVAVDPAQDAVIELRTEPPEAAIFLDGGWEAVNALYQDPPPTTAAVLFPERHSEQPQQPKLREPAEKDGLGLPLEPCGRQRVVHVAVVRQRQPDVHVRETG